MGRGGIKNKLMCRSTWCFSTRITPIFSTNIYFNGHNKVIIFIIMNINVWRNGEQIKTKNYISRWGNTFCICTTKI